MNIKARQDIARVGAWRPDALSNFETYVIRRHPWCLRSIAQ